MGMFSDWLKRDDPKGLEAARQRIVEDEEMIARELPGIIRKRRAGKNAKPAEEELRKLQKDSYDFVRREARRALESIE